MLNSKRDYVLQPSRLGYGAIKALRLLAPVAGDATDVHSSLSGFARPSLEKVAFFPFSA
jgi:hypothetical protein